MATTASVTAAFRAPYVVMAVASPPHAARTASRLVTPGLSGAARTAVGPVSESVTARATFRRTTSGGSSRSIEPAASADFDILRSGWSRSITRAVPSVAVTTSGTVNTGP